MKPRRFFLGHGLKPLAQRVEDRTSVRFWNHSNGFGMVPVEEREVHLQKGEKVRMLMFNRFSLTLRKPLNGVQGRSGLLQRASGKESRDFTLEFYRMSFHRILSETLPTGTTN